MTKRDPRAVKISMRRQRIAERIAAIQRDIDSWNENHPDKEPIVLNWDFTNDVLEENHDKA